MIHFTKLSSFFFSKKPFSLKLSNSCQQLYSFFLSVILFIIFNIRQFLYLQSNHFFERVCISLYRCKPEVNTYGGYTRHKFLSVQISSQTQRLTENFHARMSTECLCGPFVSRDVYFSEFFEGEEKRKKKKKSY